MSVDSLAPARAAAPHAAASSEAPLLVLTGVTKSYDRYETPVYALKGVDLTIRSGAFVALTGPSGSGKSTLLNIAGLLDRPDAGTIGFAGRDVPFADEAARLQLRRDHFGFVFQSYNLVPTLSALENVEVALFHRKIGGRERRERARATLDLVGLADRAGHRPREMSGGQQQRVAVARALVREPRLVVADEPTANLDAANALRLMELMDRLRKSTGAAFVVSTHDHRLLPYFPEVIPLEDGRIVS